MKPLFLLADDSPAKRDFLQSFVEKQLDVDLLFACTTEQAIHLVHEHMEIAAAFIDYEIPTQNGPAIIRALKHQHPACKVALVTAADSSAYKEDAAQAGAEAFVCTSWELDRVENTLTNLLAGWHVEMQNSAML